MMMLSLSSSSSSFSLQRIVARSRSIVRCLSSSSSAPSAKRLIGKVTSYQRNKAFGFIHSKETDETFFVHRSNIVSDLPADTHLSFPFLRTGDIVAFDVDAGPPPIIGSAEGDNTQGHRRALDVTFASGEPIPPLRKSFYARSVMGIKENLGSKVWDIMQNLDLSEEEKISKIHEGFEEAKQEVEKIEEKIQSMGMKVEDFPTEFYRRAMSPKNNASIQNEEPHQTPSSPE